MRPVSDRKRTPVIPRTLIGLLALVSGCGGGGGTAPPAIFPSAVMLHGYGDNVGDFDEDGRVDAVYRQHFGFERLVTVFGDSFDVTQTGASRVTETDFPRFVTATRGIVPVEATESDGVGDIDGDGHLDYVICTDNSLSDGLVTILFGDGTGNFPESEQFAIAGPTVEYLTRPHTLADFNDDGLLDFALARYPYSFAEGPTDTVVLMNVGGRDFADPSPIQGALGFAPWHAADFDGDGNIDLVQQDHDLAIFRGLGNGSFVSGGRAAILGPSDAVMDVLLLDIGSDGDTDLIVSILILTSPPAGARIVSLQNNGTGEFTLSAIVTGADALDPPSLNTGDLNHDGYPDFVINGPEFSPHPADVRTFLGQPDGTFEMMHAGLFMPSARPLLVDLDGDGNLDLAAGVSESNSFDLFDRVARGRGDGTFEGEDRLLPELAEQTNWEGVRFVLPGDFDGDADVDIVLGATNNQTRIDQVSFFSNIDGLGRMMQTYDSVFDMLLLQDTTSVEAVVAEVTGDSRDDVVWSYGRSLAVHPGLPDGTFAAPIRSVLVYRNGGVFPANLNGDTDVDLIQFVREQSFTPLIGYHALINDGTGRYVPGLGPLVASNVLLKSRAAVDDFDGDGLSDIVDFAEGTIGLRRGLGDGSFGDLETIAVLPDSNFGQVVSADVNGDSSPDVYFIGPETGLLTPFTAVYINSGDGEFTAIPVPPNPLISGPAVLADLDLDGRPDEAIHSRSPSGLTGALSVRLGRGPGNFGPPSVYPVRVASRANQFAAGFEHTGFSFADINGDRYPDLIGEGLPFSGGDGWPVILFNELGGAQN